MNKKLEEILLSITNSTRILNTELIQNLWSGYGSLNRVILDQKSLIVKLIEFPTIQKHPRGWNSDISHERKVKSYQVEMNWYRYYNESIKEAYSPKYIISGKIDDLQYLVLEDLGAKKFTPKTSITLNEVKRCLSWLANFHAKYLNRAPDNLWDIGTYWHLETRPDELKKLDDPDLKNMAMPIDQKLNSSKFKTLVHGDAKLANFLFNNNETAAVDFQYVGGGVGIKDVIYFLSSIYMEDELHQYDDSSLDYYFKELKKAMIRLDNKTFTDEIETEWRELYPYAWCDFYRFLKGWSPGHPKINSYLDKMKEKVFI